MNKLIYTIAALLTLTLFSACGGDDNNNEVVVLTSIAIDPVDKDLYIGDTYQLSVSHQPTDVKLPKLTWTSSDTKVATVSSSGKVTAVADGVAKITASYGDLSNSVTIAILKQQDYTSFIFYHDINNEIKNNVAGYFTEDGLCKKLGDLGNLSIGKYSNEIKVEIDTLTRVYFFSHTIQPVRIEDPYILKKNIKNIFILRSGVPTVWAEPTDEVQWPH
ncbi:Ig-like domain-containing protein [Dysgonomonas sp. 521]|uniref:Ig-like domain-containing protein n=1 Tax=Dysgonomonas sp. 521 TaxID=2302932 RepID=UPI0013D48523|nr:Ig-like domain-containing protein [Dysgonomonas sp. 521]NDV95373.1 Ig-like domain-containing protein [Dysgonomonas sp. 521]